MTDELELYPEPSARDRIEDLAMAAISLVPIIGSPAEVLIDRLVGPSLDRRRDAWFRTIAKAICELQRLSVDIETLPDNDAWVTSLIRASRIATGTHLEEKLQMLQAAIVNAALPGRPADFLTVRFLGYVEDLTTEHFLVLEQGRDRQNYERIAMESNIETRIAHLEEMAKEQGTAGTWALVRKDLEGEGLFSDSRNTPGRPSDSDLFFYVRETTELGKQLLDFVTLYEPSGGEEADGEEG